MSNKVEAQDRRALLRNALTALDELQAKLDAVERAQTEPIAIIGMSCRFPGGANDPEGFWRLLREGVDAISVFPAQRWDSRNYAAAGDASGGIETCYGGFLDQVDLFDPQFFSIAPREAAQMDPQQRLVLELSWEALETAGQAPDRLAGSQTGVFVGITTNDYWQLAKLGGANQMDAYIVTGGALHAVPGRVAYTLGLQGPCVAVDSACSSSLAAVHLACQSLRTGESDLALAGGVNIILTPEPFLCFSKWGMTAPDGRCKTFDDRANGFVRGEGCGVVVLKRFSDAIANGDNILALVRGSAVKQDGRSSGFTVPSGFAQQAVIRKALANARVKPADISYVEAHGTGTALGDPIEIEALGTVLSEGRAAGRPLLVGSVKTNIGHLESAAGIAGLIKTILSMQHEEIPPHLNFKLPSRHILWDEFPIAVPTQRTPWLGATGPRLAGVSSFGMSGTNAHVVLQEAPTKQTLPSVVDRSAHLLTLSATTAEALKEMARGYTEHLTNEPALAWGDVSFTANTGRARLTQRLAVVASDSAQGAAKLRDWLAGTPTAGLTGGVVLSPQHIKVAFLFTGQGSQYVGMGRQLYETAPVFSGALDRCAELLRGYLDKPLLSVLYPEDGVSLPLDETVYTQPALFALEYALAELWKSWGIEPSVVLGHSVGEYVAACVAGVFSLEEGLKLIAERGRLMQGLGRNGEMAVVFADEARVEAALGGYGGEISIAAINGPQNVVISGERKAVDAVVKELEAGGVKSQGLAVSHAFHSPLMEPILDEFERLALGVRYARPRVRVVLNVTGQVAQGEMSALYWRRHIREPVRFSASIELLHAQGYEVFVEIGPGATLLGMGRRCLADSKGVWLPSLRKGREDWQQILESLAELYVRGVEVDWMGFDRAYGRRRVMLPTYPFQRQRYWLEPANGNGRDGVLSGQVENLASSALPPGDECFYEIEWRSRARNKEQTTDLLPIYLPSVGEIAKQLHARESRLRSQHGLNIYQELLPQLDRLSTAYILDACQKLGWQFRRHERVNFDSLAKELGVIGKHRRLFGCLLEILREEGVLKKLDSEWEVCKVPHTGGGNELWQTLVEQYPTYNAQLTLMGHCGPSLAEVLRGERDALELLFSETSSTAVEKLYQEAPYSRVYNTLIQEAISLALEEWPAGRVVRVLEIGAGTGATASYILPKLSADRTEYIFTDISRAFILKSRERFRDYAFVRYEFLNIEEDPQEQGFCSHSFDLILAANVLHATKDLRQTVKHVSQLLKPGGLLLLLEGTGPSRWVDLVFGMTDGWWRFSDADLRPSHPLLSARQWLKLLQETGFTEAITLPVLNEGREGAEQALVMARGTQGDFLSPTEHRSDVSQRPASWLIFCDARGVGTGLAELLKARGETCVMVQPGRSYERIGDRQFIVNPAQPKDFEQLLREALPANGSTCCGVVHMWALSVAVPLEMTAAMLETDQASVCGSVLHLVQALARCQLPPLPRLWLVTRGAQPVEMESLPLAVSQSTLWGLGRVIASEHPEIWGGLVDLDQTQDWQNAASRLCEEISGSDGEDQISYRGENRYVARLVRSKRGIDSSLALQSGTYLITGGLGGLGLQMARWLVGHGVRHVLLVGRRVPSEAAREVLKELEAAGARVVVAQADVSEETQLVRVLQNHGRSMPPLRGVIHAAGVVDDASLMRQQWEGFARVFAAKVRGTWLLHTLTQHMDLKCFILFSSAASIMGTAGQGNHAAANAFLDAVAHYRRALGLSALSINWGPWSEVGAASRDDLIELFAARGLRAMTVQQNLAALEKTLQQSSPQIVVMSADWPKLLAQFPNGTAPPLFREVFQGHAELEWNRQPRARRSELLLQLKQARPSERWDLLLAHIQAEVATVLGFPPSQSLDPRQGFSDLGMDSLMALDLRNHLAASLGSALPSTLAFDYPTSCELTGYLLKEVLSLDVSAPEDAASLKTTVQTGLLEELKGLSDEKLEELINREIEALTGG